MTRKEYERRWRKKNPVKVLGKATRYRARHPEYRDYFKRRNATLPSRYNGLTYAEVLRRLKLQGGACGICRTKSPGNARWHGDHNHATNRFRGVLCSRCNMGLGLFRDDARLLGAARRYLSP